MPVSSSTTGIDAGWTKELAPKRIHSNVRDPDHRRDCIGNNRLSVPHPERARGFPMKIYIACALSHVPRGPIFDEHITFIHELAGNLKSAGHEVMYALEQAELVIAEA